MSARKPSAAPHVETIARPWTESGAASALPYVARVDDVFLRRADGDLRRFKTREAAERAAGREAARRAR